MVSSIGMTDAKWQQLQTEYLNQNSPARNTYSNNYATNSTNAVDTYESSKGNTCTDGVDDGKIGFFSAAGNIIEGVGKTIVNTAKSMVQHPIKTALGVGACFIPIVGPFIAGGFAAYGIYSGSKQLVEGVSTALSATTDAEAKDAWENVGSGAFTAGASAFALKGSAGMLKSQLKGGSTTVTALKQVKANGGSASELAQTAVTEGLKETASNISGAAQTVIQKGQKVLNKGKTYLDSAKKGTLKDTVQADVDALAQKAGEKASSAVDKAKEIKDSFSKDARQARAEANKAAKAQLEQKVQDIQNTAKNSGAEVITHKDGTFEIKSSNGSMNYYNKKGELLKTVQTQEVTSGSTTTKIETTYDADNNIVKKSSTSTTTQDGKAVVNHENTTTNNTATGVSTNKIVHEGKTVYSETGITTDGKFTGVKTVNGKAQWYENGNLLENPSAFTKIRIQSTTSNMGVNLSKAIGDGSTTFTIDGQKFVLTPQEAEMLGILTNINNEEK